MNISNLSLHLKVYTYKILYLLSLCYFFSLLLLIIINNKFVTKFFHSLTKAYAFLYLYIQAQVRDYIIKNNNIDKSVAQQTKKLTFSFIAI